MDVVYISSQFPTISIRLGHHLPKKFTPRNSHFFRCSVAFNNLSSETVEKEMESRNKILILGMGYVGQFLAKELKEQGWLVSGTCTSITKKEKLLEKGFDDVFLFNANEFEPRNLNTSESYSHLLVSIPPTSGIDDPMRQYGSLFHKLTDGNLKWLCYLSSTSVYGNCGGHWVDEEYLASPTNEKARLRLAAEEGWLKLGHDLGISAQIFRLGGIYGPLRSAVDTILKEEPLSKTQLMRESKQYTSRVHVADINQALTAAINKPSNGRIYNIVDDDPAPREEVFAFARDLVEKKWPGRTIKDPYKAESFVHEEHLKGDKRVSNARMKNELGVRLIYPNYRLGLQSIIDNLANPF